ncbi:AAA family ATPase [Embleya sp. NBC_00888]|uniref:AAA family ATPase n=1 Tax=Embleya sp. NBC_00888 TaxID=2975960 RepID=UPI00386E4A41|nr:AAA family ATPase [Embleya sp. NBC_00888]
MLHGRNDELAAVTALLQRTCAGDGGAVVLRGAAGAGKTTLLAEAVWEAKGMTVLRTAGPRGGGALPYTALRQLLATLHPRIGRLPHTRAQALRIALGLAPGAADRGVVAAAACSLVVIAAREQPVLVLVDDAHWLDAASAAVVSYIAGRAEGLPIAVLRATRERVDASADGGTSASEAGTGLAGTGGVGGAGRVAGAAGAEPADVAAAPAAAVAVASVDDEASVVAANVSVHGDASVAHRTERPASAGVFEDGAAAQAAGSSIDLSSNTTADADSTTNGRGRHGDLRPDATNRAAAEAARFDTSAQDAARVAHVGGDFGTPATHAGTTKAVRGQNRTSSAEAGRHESDPPSTATGRAHGHGHERVESAHTDVSFGAPAAHEPVARTGPGAGAGAQADESFGAPAAHGPAARTGRDVGVGEGIGEFVREAYPASAAERDAWSARAGLGDADAGVSYARCTPAAGDHTKPEYACDEREFDNLDETAATERASAHADAFDVGPGRSRGTTTSASARPDRMAGAHDDTGRPGVFDIAADDPRHAASETGSATEFHRAGERTETSGAAGVRGRSTGFGSDERPEHAGDFGDRRSGVADQPAAEDFRNADARESRAGARVASEPVAEEGRRARAYGRTAGTDVLWGEGPGAEATGADRRGEAERTAHSSGVGRGEDRAVTGASAGATGRAGGRGAAASGERRTGTGAAVAGGDVPFAALPEDARRLLALAALEPAADLDQLAVAGRRVGIGRGARLAVLRAGLVDTAEHRVRFRDASAREEVRRSLTSAERRSLHGALVYAASGALAYRRPWHLAALATGPDAELAAALEAGAGRTRRELGAGAAAATWEQAARLTADRPAARRRYVAAAYAAWEAGFPTRARTLLDTADAADLDGVADEGTSAHSSGTAIRLRAALRHAEGHRSEAGALLLDAAHGRAALLLAATGAAWEAGDRARTTQARTALAALPLAADDPLRTVVAALGADGVSPAMVAPATRARLYGLGIALWEVTPLAVHAAATDQAAYDVLLDEAAVLRTHGARGALAAALMPLAVAGALSGRAVEAETHAAEGLRLARATGQGTLAAWFLAALSMAATTQGRIAEARDGAWQALRLTGTKGLTPVGAYALYALAVVERAEGRTEAACELLAKALAAPAGALMEVRIRAELATAGPNRSGLAALPPRPTHPQLPTLALTGRITRTPQLAAGTA